MRKVRGAACVVLGLGVLIGCSTFRDQSKAMVGGGAVAGRDYINGLKPSEKARAYFAQNASDGSKAVTISRTGDGANDTGVRFVANGGVVIPPGTSITFENQGYCCDPHLPAPKAGDEYQFVKTSQLIPEQLQPIYRKLLTKASNGDEATLRSMQKLVWALRTAGTEAGYANNLTDNEKRILNSCSEYEGEFELYCSEKLAMSRFWKKLLAKADSYTTINVGGVTYQASDLLDDKVCEKKIKAHLGQLITLGESMPVEHNGFNYGELENGIYTDIRGTGSLKFKATVANSTSQPFTFYPMDYIAQVGSGVSDESESVVYYATASTMQKQRVTMSKINDQIVREVPIQNQSEPSSSPYDYVGKTCTRKLPPANIKLPNGSTFHFPGAEVTVQVYDMNTWWSRMKFKWYNASFSATTPENVGAYSMRMDSMFDDHVYVRGGESGKPPTSWEEFDHELIHIIAKNMPEFSGYKDRTGGATKNEEYLAYMISEKGRRTSDQVEKHLNTDEAYKTKEWVSW